MMWRAALPALAFASAASAAVAEPLILEVRLNGRASGAVVRAEAGPDGLAVPGEQLRALGVKTPSGLEGADGLVLLSRVPGLSYSLRPEEQVLELWATPEALAVRVVGAEAAPYVEPDPMAWGGVLNYAAYGEAPAEGEAGWSASWEARLFGPPGVLTSSWFVQDPGGFDPAGVNGEVRRLDTTFVHDDPRGMTRYLLGDFVSASQSWSRPVRGAGFSIQTDFSLRPELITAPMPSLRGAPSVPSTVDVYIDGLRQLSEPTDGPFEIRQPPVLTGYGQVTMVVTDVLGRETVQTFDFYGSDRLLRGGLTAWSAEGGWLRADYAGPRDRYTDPFGQAAVRYGVNDSLTVEGRVAAADDLVEAGGGAVFKLREWMVVGVGVNLTSGREGQGGLWRVSAERRGRRLSLYGVVAQTFGDFDDLARRAGDPPVELLVQAGAGYGFERFGNLNLNYTRQKYAVEDYGVFNLTWSKPVGRGADIYVTAYASERGVDSSGISVGFTMPLGDRGTGGGRLSSTSASGTTAAVYAQRPPPLDGGVGWRALAEAGEEERLEGEVRLRSSIGEAALGVEVEDEGVSTRAFASGAVVWLAGGGPQLAAAVGQSFVVVDTHEPDVEILHENRMIGRTRGDGRLLIPYVAPFAPTRIGIAPAHLDIALQTEAAEVLARAPRGGAVVVDLPVRRVEVLYLRILTPDGRPAPVGAAVLLNGVPTAVVGYDGLVWLSDAGERPVIEVETEGGRCRAPLSDTVIPGTAPVEVTCHAP